MKLTRENKAIKKLSSALLTASIVMAISTSGMPTALGDDDTTAQVVEAEYKESYKIASREEVFHYPAALDYKDFNDFILINNNSLIAAKTPPSKKYVPTSRMWIFVTAYSSTPDQTDSTPFITASGNHVRDGIIAANFLPMHAKVRFPTLYGDKVFVVEDRMNERYYYRADIWMRTREQAKHFGIKNVPIEIVRQL